MTGRRFTRRERAALLLEHAGCCAWCGAELQRGWHADHVVPWAHGGPTDVGNGQPLCAACNLRKGDRVAGSSVARAAWPETLSLRKWQERAFEDYTRFRPARWLVECTPGGGKTLFAVRVAYELLRHAEITRVLVVVPSDHLRVQWARQAARVGVQLDPQYRVDQGALLPDYDGACVTYQALAKAPLSFRVFTSRARTLVVLDEIHHAAVREGESAWGTHIREACEPAMRVLCLSGTPFRTDNDRMPFVEYAADEQGVEVSQPDFRYGYGEALRDGVCRAVTFPHYEGDVAYLDRRGDECRRRFANAAGEEQMREVLRAVLDPTQDYVESVLRDAHQHLVMLRKGVPNAGGLVAARRIEHARAIADRLATIAGERPPVITSDEPGASEEIKAFAASAQPWLVSVKMVSEGVDIPRLMVGVFATDTLTEMFFRQFVGRFVRTETRDDEQVAAVFMPAAPPLLEFAARIKEQRDHVLNVAEACERDGGGYDCGPPPISRFTVLEATAEHVGEIFNQEKFAPEELYLAARLRDAVGFGPSVPLAQLAQAARFFQREGLGAMTGASRAPTPDTPVIADERTRLRKKREALVSRVAAEAAQATGRPMFRDVNRAVAAATGKYVDKAPLDTLRAQINLLQRWLSGEGNPWRR